MKEIIDRITKKYIPTSKDWKHSVILFILTHATGLILPVFIFWFFIALFFYFSLTLNPFALVVIVCSLLSFCSVFISYWVALIPYSIVQIICDAIFDNPVNLLDLKPSRKDFDKKFTEYLLIVIISSLPFFIIQLIIAICNSSEGKSLEAVFNYIDIEDLIIILSPNTVLQFSWIWLIVAAYLHKLLNSRN